MIGYRSWLETRVRVARLEQKATPNARIDLNDPVVGLGAGRGLAVET